MVTTSDPMPLAAVGDVARIDVRGYGSALVSFVGGAVALAGGSVILEATNVLSPQQSDFFSVQAAVSSDRSMAFSAIFTAANLNPGQTLSSAYRLNVAGYTFVQARMTARTSGDIFAQWSRDFMPFEPVPAAIGSVTANPPTGTAHNIVTTATTNAVTLQGSGCNLDEITISNPTATPAFVKLYNKATSPSVGTDIPVATIPVPANGFVNVPFPNSGKRFGSGLSIAVTGGQAATDATATVAGIVINLTRR